MEHIKDVIHFTNKSVYFSWNLDSIIALYESYYSRTELFRTYSLTVI